MRGFFYYNVFLLFLYATLFILIHESIWIVGSGLEKSFITTMQWHRNPTE